MLSIKKLLTRAKTFVIGFPCPFAIFSKLRIVLVKIKRVFVLCTTWLKKGKSYALTYYLFRILFSKVDQYTCKV
jgi:hypothetical protein